jgi:hypothetical protein
MNSLLAGAGAVLVVTGLVLSVFGERLIFRRMRRAGALIPTDGGSALREPHVRILWATWHALSVIGWALAALLLWYAHEGPPMPAPLGWAVVGGTTGSSLLVQVGTKGRHPGWMALLTAAVLTLLGMPSPG